MQQYFYIKNILNLPSYVEIYNLNRVKTVKAEMPIPC